jgi:hypothetical protein
MALINCPDCNKGVSQRAAACIHCGCPLHVDLKGQPSAGSAQANKEGQQRSKLRNDIGGAIAFVGLPVALVVGMATSFTTGWMVAMAVCVLAAVVHYS